MRKIYPCPFCIGRPKYNPDYMHDPGNMHQCPYFGMPLYGPGFDNQYFPFIDEEKDDDLIKLTDYGPEPFVINIDEAAKQNDTFRTALWTGKHLQVTLMSIKAGEDIGLEIHPSVDQFIRIEAGQGIVKMGDREDRLDFQKRVYNDYAIFIPAGKWHNLINTGNKPVKLYSIYAPPQHPKGTVHKTKADAEAAEKRLE